MHWLLSLFKNKWITVEVEAVKKKTDKAVLIQYCELSKNESGN